jgi:toxin CcdB
MAQFFAYENTNRATQKTYPFLLDIQSNLLSDLRTTVVIPLSSMAMAGRALIAQLCPMVEINHEKYMVLTQQLSGIDRKNLGKEVADLSQIRSEIISALDFMVSGI